MIVGGKLVPKETEGRQPLSQCNTRLRLLHLLYDISRFYSSKTKHVFDQSERAQGPIYIVIQNKEEKSVPDL